VIQITPQMRILVAIEAVDGRKGIDSLARLCQDKFRQIPSRDACFCSAAGEALRSASWFYDGQGFWLEKRLSQGRFAWWPTGKEPARTLQAHQAQLLLAAGNPDAEAAPVWRRVSL
jgi:transposase